MTDKEKVGLPNKQEAAKWLGIPDDTDKETPLSETFWSWIMDLPGPFTDGREKMASEKAAEILALETKLKAAEQRARNAEATIKELEAFIISEDRKHDKKIVRLRAARQPVAVSDRLPDNADSVLIKLKGSDGIHLGQYYRQFEVECFGDFADGFAEYDEETDEFYYPEGWCFEGSDGEDNSINWAIQGYVESWMNIPTFNTPPKTEEGK